MGAGFEMLSRIWCKIFTLICLLPWGVIYVLLCMVVFLFLSRVAIKVVHAPFIKKEVKTVIFCDCPL